MSVPDAFAGLPRLPVDDAGPVFREPWEAQAFALAVRLSQDGAFTWPEWAEALAHELATDPTDDGSRYYHHWVAALEKLVASRGLSSPAELAGRKSAWAQAYRRTPHGRPVELSAVLESDG